ncbi:uncharacterized protein P174DRAFT_428151 [Aspergillus novofumigatus IBT 16806]|uniref:Uncharacterized protein n=1 Tax=Aspergillus novofumigatus (strain IBT 16806) TaxID=1392255 RepID=A0A2I1CG65_ASPN1|nr:uncharacterized protein P174DRAFT_428151 [Aspergillus novofumigatus IBT 16806]PKX96615.1 hypothetical protein P174DRAFT_428151 [Aspergillus novofumigatus IBT 16806]
MAWPEITKIVAAVVPVGCGTSHMTSFSYLRYPGSCFFATARNDKMEIHRNFTQADGVEQHRHKHVIFNSCTGSTKRNEDPMYSFNHRPFSVSTTCLPSWPRLSLSELTKRPDNLALADLSHSSRPLTAMSLTLYSICCGILSAWTASYSSLNR